MFSSNPVALVVGGTSGLGAQMAIRLATAYEVHITGRKRLVGVNAEKVHFHELRLDDRGSLSDAIGELVEKLPPLNLFVYAAGFFQKGAIDDLHESAISAMIDVGLQAPAFFLHHILARQRFLQGFIAITSTSQWTPRREEPIYTAVKAGLGMLAHSVSLDTSVERVVVAAPSGMRTRFWEQDGRDTSSMLDPDWVAAQILAQYKGAYGYKFLKILRDPPRVEVAEER
ncbi:MAG: SDR family oxidoreductase [Patescibacteria group bacterium]|nr:SDR family oxidoreductase [Patescibacteria group bacterium]